jgi:homoserine O-acetyltransferase
MAHRIHRIDRLCPQYGGVLPPANLAFATHGTLNAKKTNAVLFPTWFNNSHLANQWLIGEGMALDPRHWFIIVVNIFGNGVSSSPSNTPAPGNGPAFPRLSLLDNVMAQHDLVCGHFGIDRLALVVGRSMGAQVAFQWASMFPDNVARVLPFCGSARTAAHNFVFLEALRSAIVNDPAWEQGRYTEPPHAGLRNVQTIFDGWAYSQAYYRQGLHLLQGYATTAEFVRRPLAVPQADANDTLAQIDTWQHADISANPRFGGDLAQALGAISARAIVMPCRTDLYFPPEDSENEVALMPNAELRVIPSVWGHRAGAPGTDPADIRFVDQAVRDLLAA